MPSMSCTLLDRHLRSEDWSEQRTKELSSHVILALFWNCSKASRPFRLCKFGSKHVKTAQAIMFCLAQAISAKIITCMCHFLAYHPVCEMSGSQFSACFGQRPFQEQRLTPPDCVDSVQSCSLATYLHGACLAVVCFCLPSRGTYIDHVLVWQLL